MQLLKDKDMHFITKPSSGQTILEASSFVLEKKVEIIILVRQTDVDIDVFCRPLGTRTADKKETLWMAMHIWKVQFKMIDFHKL